MEVIQNKSWFQRNWPWVVPAGCCGCGCLGFILIFVFGIGAAFFGVSSIIDKASKKIENSTPVSYAKEKAFNHPEVIKHLGDSIKMYGIPSGEISLNNNDGRVDFSIPIKGNLGFATIIVRGIKVDGNWVYEDLYVIIKDTQQQINLLQKTLQPI